MKEPSVLCQCARKTVARITTHILTCLLYNAIFENRYPCESGRPRFHDECDIVIGTGRSGRADMFVLPTFSVPAISRERVRRGTRSRSVGQLQKYRGRPRVVVAERPPDKQTTIIIQ